MITVRLDRQTQERLERLAKETNRPISYCVKEAIKQYLSEQEDYEMALTRLHEPADEIISPDEMRERLGLHGK